jgi:hypothetical protein
VKVVAQEKKERQKKKRSYVKNQNLQLTKISKMKIKKKAAMMQKNNSVDLSTKIKRN